MSSDVTSNLYQRNINSANPFADEIYEFDRFRLDVAHRMLYEENLPVQLAPKVIETLIVLVERRSELISKKELMNLLWADSFVEESNLTQNIYLLRKTLGKGADGRDLIESFRRRGYRFTGKIKSSNIISDVSDREKSEQGFNDVENSEQLDTFNPPTVLLNQPVERINRKSRSNFFRNRWYLFAAFGLLLLAVFGLYKTLSRKEIKPPSKPIQLTRLTTNARTITAAVSPDGKLIAYVVSANEGQSLWIRQIATSSDMQILPPEEEVLYGGLTFSPDGNHIYYVRFSRNGNQSALFKMPTFGGTSMKLLQNIDGPVSFSPDGSRFTFVRNLVNTGESFLMTANSDGTDEKILAKRNTPQSFQPGPAWSPDGKRIVCGGKNLSGNRMPVNPLEISLHDGTEKQIGEHTFISGGRFQWLSDGSGLIMTGMDRVNLSGQLYFLSYPDGEIRKITNDLIDYSFGISLSADSNVLVATPRDYTSKIWVLSGKEPSSAKQVTSGRYDGIWGISWTPDGKLVHATSELRIFSVEQDGANQKLLTPEENNKRYSSVSPDGRYIVFQSWRENTVGIWRIDIDGSNLKRLTSGIDTVPQVSPDGKWVIFSSARSRRYTLWKVSIDGGEPVQLTDKYTLAPSISPDGKEIACFYWDEQPNSQLKIAVLPFEGGEFTKLFEPSLTRFSYPFLLRNTVHWTPDGQSLTYIKTLNNIDNLWNLSVADGQTKQITEFKSDRIFAFEWSRDGQSLACARGTMTSDVVLINDFR